MHLPLDILQSRSFWAVTTLGVGFLIYLVLYLSEGVRRRLRDRYGENENLAWVVMTKLSGFLLLGVLPAMVIWFILREPLSGYGANMPNSGFGWGWLIGGSLFILFFNILQGRRPAHYGMYPLIRSKRWGIGMLTLSLVTSALFIIGYEFVFRGFLLHACVPLMGVWVAIAVNVLLYSLAHIHKGLPETLMSVPFGILVCWITLESGSFLPIMVMHVTLSLTADLVAIYFNKEMSYNL